MTAPPRTAWRSVRDAVRAAILDGRYGPGDRLPRDADIARAQGCARSTVQRAMQDLSDAGLIDRRRKGGTRVRAEPLTRATLDIPIIRREVETAGAVHGYRLLRRAEEVPPRAVLDAFETGRAAPMLRVEALHLADGRPYLLEDRWICTATVPEIRAIDLARMSANEWLVLHRPHSRCDLRLEARAADAQAARRLACAAGTALFVMARTTWIDGAPITHVTATGAPGYRLHARI